MKKFTSLRNRLLVYFGVLIFGIIITQAVISYSTVKGTLQKDIRQKQLLAFLEASQSDIRSTLEKGLEASISLADDPLLGAWFEGGEEDESLSFYALDKLDMLNKKMGYPNSFAVSHTTKNFYTHNHQKVFVLSEDKADDVWYFNLLKTGEKSELNYDYNPSLDQTLFFFNVVMGDVTNPKGIAGVGVDPGDLIKQFTARKITPNSQIWMVDASGKVIIAEDVNLINTPVSGLMNQDLVDHLLKNNGGVVMANQTFLDDDYDFAAMPVGNTGFTAVLAAPVSELLTVIEPIKTSTTILSILFLAITMGVVIWLARSISSPLQKVTVVANHIADGDLRDKLEGSFMERADELGTLARSFERLRSQIFMMIEQASKATVTITNGSEELSKSSTTLAESATEQASSTEELSASMEEMSSNISQNSENSNETVLIVQDAAKDAQNGESILSEAVKAIEDINESVILIEDVARQTNILALNAAIEAARAGEQGRGFAVVAGEVRRLAERSRVNAEKINQLSANSLQIAHDAIQIFSEMLPKIMKSTELVLEISAASKEQNIGAGQINNALLELDRVSQLNAQAAEDINGMVKYFKDEVGKLSQTIGYFRI